jgi:hypothetical protein
MEFLEVCPKRAMFLLRAELRLNESLSIINEKIILKNNGTESTDQRINGGKDNFFILL